MKKEIKDLNKAVANLKAEAEKTREAVERKRAWMEEKSETWQDSGAAMDLDDQLSAIEDYLDEIDNLPEPEIE